MITQNKVALALTGAWVGLILFAGQSSADQAKPTAPPQPATQPAVTSNTELNFSNCMLAKSTFHRVAFGQASVTDSSLAGAKFDDVNLGQAGFENINLAGAKFHNINLSGATFRDINFANVDIADANLTSMKINGILVTDLLAAYEKTKP
jgi:uncharacterized protein YjbI with pentapeptide repeats